MPVGYRFTLTGITDFEINSNHFCFYTCVLYDITYGGGKGSGVGIKFAFFYFLRLLCDKAYCCFITR